MSSPAGLTRARVKTIFDTEFASEGWTVANDKLPRAAGMDGDTHVACYPEAERENENQVGTLIVPVVLQLYLAYNAEPDETIVVDPSVIEGYAYRLRGAFQSQSSGNDADLWFLRLRYIEYPDDPTGNKSRLEAFVEGICSNPAGTPAG